MLSQLLLQLLYRDVLLIVVEHILELSHWEMITIFIYEQLDLIVWQISIVAREPLHCVCIRQCLLNRCTCRNRERLIYWYHYWASRRHGHLYIHSYAIKVSNSYYHLFLAEEFLDWILHIHAVPYILICLQLDSISLPISPIEVDSRLTVVVAIFRLESELDRLIASQFYINLLYIPIIEFLLKALYFLHKHLQEVWCKHIKVNTWWNWQCDSSTCCIVAVCHHTYSHVCMLVTLVSKVEA